MAFLVVFAVIVILVPTSRAYSNTQQDYSQYRQPDDITNGQYDNFRNNPSNVCARTCGGPPKICYWEFTVQMYSTMGPACGNCPNTISDCSLPQCVAGDGFNKSIIAVNRMIPGPSIQVCLGDTIVVDVKNEMIGKHTTIHWHGIFQTGTPWMDGVYMVTQCPISPGQTFRYRFTADRPGTHYWHDHSGLIKIDGVQSSIVVREPPTRENNGYMYDFDLPSHTIFLQDWKHFISDADLPDEIQLGGERVVDSFLINGRGYYNPTISRDINPGRDVAEARRVPLSVINVRGSARYRLRIVGGICGTCGATFSIDRHRMTLIASDGSYLRPITVDSVNVLPGERFDVVVETNQPVGSYWITVKGTDACMNTHVLGVLRYQGSNQDIPSQTSLTLPGNPVVGNTVDVPNCDSQTKLCIGQLKANMRPPNQIYGFRNNYRQLIQFGFYTDNVNDLFRTNTFRPYYQPLANALVRPTINNISFGEPSSPLLTQLYDNPSSKFCSDQCRTYRSPKDCICLDPIRVPVGGVLDMIVTDTDRTDGLTHPFHLHGHAFYVLETGSMGLDYDRSLLTLMRRVENGQVDVDYPAEKDTIALMNNGYAIIRMIANNPGMWLVHCHFLYHHLLGMTTYLQVGDFDRDFPRPPSNFPKCGNFF